MPESIVHASTMPAVRIEGLWKQYTLGEGVGSYETLRESISTFVSDAIGRLRTADSRDGERPKIWALKDITFDAAPGQVIGIIGRNGAGKSTLLKVLSRITEPTRGRAELRGRVGSLLEVGTGFHPELTGRENIQLNGAILGMRRAEISRKFDEIVEFAEVEPFLDTPLKRYSSGMYVRLAFSVAAHLQLEILIVDEVLAVGDLSFQRKCLGRMDDVAKDGRTVLFVSHQMNQIRRLCNQVAWINEGELVEIGDSAPVVGRYEESILGGHYAHKRSGSGFTGWEIAGGSNVINDTAAPVELVARIRLAQAVSKAHFGFKIANVEGVTVAGWAFEGLDIDAGEHAITLSVPYLPLRPGTYALTLALFDQGNNLTGGNLVDNWEAVPYLLVDDEIHSHPQDLYAGVMNIPMEVDIRLEV